MTLISKPELTPQTHENPPKKRVLFIVTQSEFGGAQRYLYEILTNIDSNKFEVLAAAGPDGNWEFLNALKDKGIEVKKLLHTKRKLGFLSDSFAIIELIKLIKSFKPNTLFLNSSKVGITGSIAGKILKWFRKSEFRNLKIIYRIGGWSFNDPHSLLYKKILIFLERLTAPLKDVIILNNQSDFLQAQKLKIKPKNMQVIYNGINPMKVDFLSRDEARLKIFEIVTKFGHRKIFRTKTLMGSIANFYPTKDLTNLIEATTELKKQFPNFFLILIGGGEEKEKIKTLITKNNLSQNVILLGQIRDARRYLKAFDIFVLPSAKEGFPWTVIEAMAAKVPVIATNVGGIPEIIDSGKNGIIVSSKNPEELANAMLNALSNERLCQELGIQGHQKVLFKFGLDKMLKSTEELF